MSYPLNPEQFEAVSDFQFDLLVTAGAGTGKTGVLTNKFLRLLEERRANVGEIVAITFTKKAAAEMRERIRAQIQQNIQSATNPGDLQFWKEQLLEIESARIGTFHGFCLGLIREHSLEAGLSPVTGVLDTGEETIYIYQAIESALTEYIRDTGVLERDKQVLLKILMDFGWDGFQSSIAAIYRTIRESGMDFDGVIGRSIASTQRAIANCPYGTSHLMEEMEDLLAFVRTASLNGRTADLMGSLQEEWPGYREALMGNDFLNDILPVFDELKRALPLNLANIIKERAVVIRKMIDACHAKLLDQEALERLPVFGKILKGIDRFYMAGKQESGYLDFSDQLIYARDLLRDHPELTREIKAGIRYILVDEFQDTNSLQMEIVELLRGDGYEGGRLMVVGDIKQSIYRFRGAEADLILKLASEFGAGSGRLLSLNRNYRSASLLLEFVNRISTALFEGEAFEYEPLETVQDDHQDAAIEFILSNSDNRLAEARMAASRIRQLVEPSGSTARFRFSDIVILFRTKTAIPVYQTALREQGIPYYTASGGDFYRCPEIVDQINILRLTLKRHDGIALLGLLTSPYVGLSDESLLWLAKGDELIRRFYESEEFPVEIPPMERQRLVRFRKAINLLQEQREYLGIPGILRVALEQCLYYEVLWSFPDSGQRLANLEKLLTKADEFAAKGFHDLQRFLAYIEELQETEIMEGEAPTEMEAGDAVRLMTVHRSKGLEFPVVFIPDLDRQFRRNFKSRLAYQKDTGLGFTIGYGENETGSTSNWEWIKDFNRRQDISELKRLLYVGLTRAKQQLFLVGSGRSKSKAATIETANNWMKWFELLLPLGTAGSVLDFQGTPIRINREALETGKPAKIPDSQGIDFREIELETGSLIPSVAETAATTVVVPVRIPVTLKVTELLSFKACPRRYYWRYRRHLTDNLIMPVSSSVDMIPDSEWDEPAEPGLGTLIGKFVHQAVRLSGSKWPEDLWEQNFLNLKNAGFRKLKEDLAQIWSNFRKSPFTETAGECFDEVPFKIKMNEQVYIEGRFDRLIRTQDGKLILVDYKTHRLSGNRVDSLAEQYYWQLQLYALAVKALWDNLPDRAVLYFMYPDRMVEVPLERGILERLKGEVLEIAQYIGKHDRLDEYGAGDDDCQGCGYEKYCKTLLNK